MSKSLELAVANSDAYKSIYGWEMWKDFEDEKPDEKLYRFIVVIKVRTYCLSRNPPKYDTYQSVVLCEYENDHWTAISGKREPVSYKYWMPVPTPDILGKIDQDRNRYIPNC